MSQPREFIALRNLGIFCLTVAASASALMIASSVRDHFANSQTSGPSAAPTELHAERRFQLTQLGEFRRDQFLLDQDTGRIWHPVCMGTISGADCQGQVVWQEMKFEGNPPLTAGWLDEILKNADAKTSK